jgi:hypothetical protein
VDELLFTVYFLNPICRCRYWSSVDLYVGGAEHSVLHLLYARFWHKVLYDIGAVSTKEPFQCLVNQGMILGEVLRHILVHPCTLCICLFCTVPGLYEHYHSRAIDGLIQIVPLDIESIYVCSFFRFKCLGGY